jgi:hypothetical protein
MCDQALAASIGAAVSGKRIEPVQEYRLRGVRLRHAAQAKLSVRRGWQHNVMRLNARKLFQDCAC